MLLEVRAASRKTPGDGRFEISENTARRLTPLASPLQLELDALPGHGHLEQMMCTCQKAGEPHVHHFLVSDVFRAMHPERTYALELMDGGLVRLTGAHDGLR